MENHGTLFDQCRTAAQIQAQLQHLAKELLAVTQRPQNAAAQTAAADATIDLNVLPELAYADLKEHEHPVRLLSEICRLLIKAGDRPALRRCLALSHVIYGFKCRQNESYYIAYIYKGIAQIGLQSTDLGVKNALRGLATHPAFVMLPIDQALGFWALMSAAIANRNLKLALIFAEKWRAAAQIGHLTGEVCRARLVMLLLHLLADERECCTDDLSAIMSDPPAEWQETAHFLADWRQAIIAGRCPASLAIAEPYPLLLGLDWRPTPHLKPLPQDRTVKFSEKDGHCEESATKQSRDTGEIASSKTPRNDNENLTILFPQGERAKDFSALCEIRRNFCNERIQSTLATVELEKYADLLAQWELPRPLCELETVLKKRAPETYFRANLTRLLGQPVLNKIFTETPLDPPMVRRDQAIILVTDVRKFSALSEHRTPEGIFDLLNPIFKILSEELEPVGGTILEFVGDSIILVFNTFQDEPADLTAILFHTIRSLQRIYVLNAMSYQTEMTDICLGVGIHQGPVALGYLGGLQRCHLTVLGNTVNLAARLESASKELPGDVIVSSACFDRRPPDVWRNPAQVNFSLRDIGEHTMRNIAQPVHLFGLKPLLPYWVDFVPMGFVASPERGVVYLDTGNAAQPGIIDHHFEHRHADSACESLVKHPELLLAHVNGLPPSQIEFRLHAHPDFDCVATLYAAHELLDQQPRHDLLQKLAEYTSKVDRANIPHPEWMNVSLYGMFRAHQLLASQHYGASCTDLHRVENGLRVIDAAMFLMEAHPQEGDFASIFRFEPEWFVEERRLLEDDLAIYQEDVALRSHTYAARVNGLAEPVIGIWLDHPRSMFFRIWGWNDPNAPGGRGYSFLAIDFSTPGKNRYVIGVSPESGTHLNGLGQVLERHETQKRERLGKQRPIHPIRYPADNSDPWYFGQGHNYALVDSPGQGTMLTAEEMQRIHASWRGQAPLEEGGLEKIK